MHDVEIKKEKDLQLTNLSTIKEVSLIIYRILRDIPKCIEKYLKINSAFYCLKYIL